MSATRPGWYPDPGGAPAERWWTGAVWSDAVRPRYQAPVAYYGGAPVVAQRNGAATAGLVLGIVSLFINSLLLVSTPAFICSIVGLTRASQLERSGFGAVGRAAAVWGLILSIVASLATVFLKFFLF